MWVVCGCSCEEATGGFASNWLSFMEFRNPSMTTLSVEVLEDKVKRLKGNHSVALKVPECLLTEWIETKRNSIGTGV